MVRREGNPWSVLGWAKRSSRLLEGDKGRIVVICKGVEGFLGDIGSRFLSLEEFTRFGTCQPPLLVVQVRGVVQETTQIPYWGTEVGSTFRPCT